MAATDKEDLAEKARIARLRATNESIKLANQKKSEETAKEATEKVVMEGGSSTDKANRLKGETASEANERITEAYKNLTAKPVLSQEQIDAGAKVQWVRTGAGGVGEWTVVVPPGYKGPRTTTKWTDGIIPGNSKYTTGSSVGKKIVNGKVVGGGSTPTITAGSKDGKTEGTGTKYNTKFESGRQAERIDKLRADAAASGKKLSFKDLGEWTINAYDRDPVTGKERTAKEVVDAMLADLNLVDPESIKETYKGATRVDVTGKTTREWNLGEIKQQLLYSVANSGKDERFTYRQIASDVTNYLRSNASQGLREIFAKDKSFWQGVYNPEDVGKIVTSPYAEDLGRKVYLVDPNNPVVPKNILEQLQGQNVQFIDPVTGNALNIDPRTGNVVDYGTFLGRVTPKRGYDYLGNYLYNQVFDENGNLIEDDGAGAKDGMGTGDNAGNGTGNGAGDGSGTGSLSGTAKDVFRNVLAKYFGNSEIKKPWVDEVYNLVSKYTKIGANPEEAFNMAVMDARNISSLTEFRKRFKGIYALQDKREAGQPVTVPTVAEYFATQTKMAELLKSSGLDKIANEDFLGDVIGKGVSATEFGNRITLIFDRIDLAPAEMKDTLGRYFPTLDRIQLATALAMGDKGIKQLQKELAGYEILAAAEEQGVGALGAGAIAGGLTEERALSLAAAGETYGSALGKFRTVAGMRQPVEKLTGIYGTGPMTQADIENIVFKQSAKESAALESLVKAEEAQFSAQAGTIGSRSFASQARGAGLI